MSPSFKIVAGLIIRSIPVWLYLLPVYAFGQSQSGKDDVNLDGSATDAGLLRGSPWIWVIIIIVIILVTVTLSRGRRNE
jgi:hypothetical protein